MATVDQLRAFYPQFQTESDVRLQLFLNQASNEADPTTFGASLDWYVINLALHYLACAPAAASGVQGTGQVVRVKEGDLEVQYAQSQGADAANLGSTGYGRICQQLQERLVIGFTGTDLSGFYP